MQLKARIKRIERKINHSPFCACKDFAGMIKPRVEVVFERNGVQTIDNSIADFCERCRKPIEKRRIIVRFVKNEN